MVLSCYGQFEPRELPDAGDGGIGACRDVTCSSHGRCVAEDGGTWCDCFSGFHAEGLACVGDAADGDADTDTDTDADLDLDVDGDPDPDAPGPCMTDDQCPDGLSRCVDGRCVQCTSDWDCPEARPFCEANACVECIGAQDCPAYEDCIDGRCVSAG